MIFNITNSKPFILICICIYWSLCLLTYRQNLSRQLKSANSELKCYCLKLLWIKFIECVTGKSRRQCHYLHSRLWRTHPSPERLYNPSIRLRFISLFKKNTVPCKWMLSGYLPHAWYKVSQSNAECSTQRYVRLQKNWQFKSVEDYDSIFTLFKIL